ncbi:MAG: LptA/OstA family protein [Verrucomicrobiales bacterium]|nr:LptA/OstA family protein [Verrucomicrobiales bacterium]
MKNFITVVTVLVVATQPMRMAAQESAAEQAESAGRTLFDSPGFQNVLRSVKKDPEATVSSIKEDPENSVREATQMFLQGKEKLESSSLNTAENREKARQLTETAVSTVTEMAENNEDVVSEARAAIEAAAGTEIPTAVTEQIEPVATALQSNVPATRPAATATQFVTPIAMPNEDSAVPLAADAIPMPVVQNESIEPIANAEPTQQQIPDSPELDPGNIPAPQPLSPKYDTTSGSHRGGTGGNNEMVITSRSSVMDNNSGILTFTGDVFVDYPDFDIKCDRLEIFMDKVSGGPPTEGGGSFKKAVASGGMVEIIRMAAGGKKQVAIARRAEFDKLTNDVVLSGGPPYIQDGDSYVETSSADAKIIMRGNGKYEITGSDAGTKGRSRIVIPVRDTGQNTDAGIGGGLGGILDRGR